MQAILTHSTGGRPRAGEHAGRRRRPRRVRVVALVLLGALGCTVAGLGQAGAAGGGREPVVWPAGANGRHVVVTPGDTLWAIAVRHAPADLDPRYAVYLLRSLNNLDSALLQVGQKLRLPSRWPGPN